MGSVQLIGGLTRNRFAVLAFVVAVAYWPGIFSAASMPRWWAIAIGLPLVSNVGAKGINRSVGWYLLVGICWAAGTLGFLEFPLMGALDLYLLLLLCGIILASSALDDIEPTIVAFGWGIAISSAMAMSQALGWSPIVQIAAPAGLFLNSEVLAEVAAPLLVFAFWSRRWLLASFMYVPLALCHSRIAVLVAVIGLAYGWKPKFRLLKIGLIAGLCIGAGVSIAIFGIGKAASGLDRILLWSTAVELITPLGRGLSWWALAHPDPREEFVHSDALQMMVELGVGSLFFLAIPFMALRQGWGNRGERATYVSICVEAVVSFPLHLPAQGFLFACLAGFLARDRAPVRGMRSASRVDDGVRLRWEAPFDLGMDIERVERAVDLPVRSAPP